MGRELRLPPELENFIARPGPITMVIRGPPGSGKTTLSLAMLEAFYGRKMFITGRRAKRGVLEDFPWLGSVEGHEIEVVDAVSASDGDPEPNPSMEAGEPANREDLHTNVLQSLPPAFRRAWGRRSSGAADLERQLALLPPGMRRALAHAASDQRVMIVVDSWDAFVEECLDLLPSNPNVRLNREEIERLALR
ncbi:MAG TPA: hypothetical protein VGS23_04705, partial [Thermoplasmata archaeon]|nr:hypothetical protein [Thermoplasmata archaeon]